MAQVPNIKFKTEYCHSWREGKKLSTQGSFARKQPPASSRMANKNQEQSSKYNFQSRVGSTHSASLSPSTIQNHDEIMRQNSYTSPHDIRPPNYKTIFCKFYAEGNCKLGNKCTYAHQRREKRPKRPSQQYREQEQNEMALSWQNYQLYQYYTQPYLNQYLPQGYIYEPQNENFNQENYDQQPPKLEGNYCVNQSPNSSNNIKEQLTFNQPNQALVNNQPILQKETEPKEDKEYK